MFHAIFQFFFIEKHFEVGKKDKQKLKNPEIGTHTTFLYIF